MAKEAGVKVSMDLANVALVRSHQAFILETLEKYVDIVFCNESEAKELLGLSPS